MKYIIIDGVKWLLSEWLEYIEWNCEIAEHSLNGLEDATNKGVAK